MMTYLLGMIGVYNDHVPLIKYWLSSIMIIYLLVSMLIYYDHLPFLYCLHLSISPYIISAIKSARTWKHTQRKMHNLLNKTNVMFI